jgi:hypothetical protein
MALVLKDRVQEQGTANTTVSFSLTTSVTGFQSFSVIGNGNTTYYAGTDLSGNWEAGVEERGLDEFLKNPQQDALPSLGIGQLLRSCKNVL